MHRNVCPTNILFDNKGYLRLSDFLLARPFSDDNAQDSCGNPQYMGPEIIF